MFSGCGNFCTATCHLQDTDESMVGIEGHDYGPLEDNTYFFPFMTIESDQEYFASVQGLSYEEFRMTSLNDATLVQGSDTDSLPIDLGNSGIDPDINMFNEMVMSKQYIDINNLKLKTIAHRNLNCMMHFNCRSINSKITELILLLSVAQPDFVALTETWVAEGDIGALSIPGYNVVSVPRKGKTGGGVALLIRQGILFNEIEITVVPAHETYEGVFVGIPQSKGSIIVLGSVYRPPGHSVNDFNQELTILLSQLSKSKNQVILGGDFNIDLLNTSDHGPSLDFINIMNSQSLLPVINYPTRITCSTATLIDNIFVKNVQDIIEPSILVCDFSDHYPLVTWFSKVLETRIKRAWQPMRIVNDKSIEKFHRSLELANWSQAYEGLAEKNPEMAYNGFISEYMQHYNNAFIFTEKPDRNSTPNKVWMTKGLLASCKKKNKLYLKSIKQPTALNITNYKNYRNKFKAIKVKMESKYYEQEFAKHAHDTKNTWRVIKSLLNGSTGADKINALKLNDGIVTDPFTLLKKFR